MPHRQRSCFVFLRGSGQADDPGSERGDPGQDKQISLKFIVAGLGDLSGVFRIIGDRDLVSHFIARENTILFFIFCAVYYVFDIDSVKSLGVVFLIRFLK